MTNIIDKKVGELSRKVQNGIEPSERTRIMYTEMSEPLSGPVRQVIGELSEEDLEGMAPDIDPENRTRRLGQLIILLAHMGKMHNPKMPLGYALHNVGYSDMRMERLMRSSGDDLADAFLRAVGFLISKGHPANMAEAARILMDNDAEYTRHCVSDDYFDAERNDV